MKAKVRCGGLWSTALLIVGFLVLSGCGTTQNPDAGKIYVDRPEVFTRQRLINRRLAEQKWLENQLEKDADFSLQGYRDVREFTGFALALKGQFDPLSGAQAESLLPDAQRNPRIGELQDALQVEILQKQIDYVQTNEFLFTTKQLTVTNPPAPQTNVANPLPAASATINLNTFTTSNLPVLPNPTNRYRSGAQLTSIQTLDDKLAYRNAIQARLREQELDDTHDLLGMTLYTLKFDITVAAGENNPSLGEVKLEIAGTGEDLTTNDFENWVAALDRELRDESVGLQQRYLMGFLTEDEKLRLMALAIHLQSEIIGTIGQADSKPPSPPPQVKEFRQNPTRQTALALLVSTNLAQTTRAHTEKYLFLYGLLEELNRGKPGSNGCQGLAFVVHDRYGKALGGSVSLPQPTNRVSLEGNMFSLVTAEKGDYEKFTNAVEQARQAAKPSRVRRCVSATRACNIRCALSSLTFLLYNLR